MITAHETEALSADLYALLRMVDPASFRDEVEAEARDRLERITRRARALLAAAPAASEAAGATDSSLRARVGGVLSAVERALAAAPTASRAFWARFQREVHPAYEALAAALRSGHAVAPVLRPTNYPRSIFHVTSAAVALLMIVLMPTRGWLCAAAAVFFLFCWSQETARRIVPGWNDKLMRFFGPVAHAHERHRVNSATWYSTALMALALTTRPWISATAVVVLGLADPAAGLVGRRFGRTKLRAGRSLEGTLAFFAVGATSAFVALAVFGHLGLGARVAGALTAGVAGALAELFSTRLDDNLTIPLSVAAAVSLALHALGAA